MSISVPNLYFNDVTEHGDMIKGDDDAFHEDDDNVSLEGLDDDDDISATPDASMCIVRCHPHLDHGCHLDLVVPQICHKRPPYSKGGRSYPTCGLTCASILAGGPTNAPSHRTGQYGGASRAGSNSSYLQNALQSRVSSAISDVAQYLSSFARELKALPMECVTILEGQLDLYLKLLHLIRLRLPECRLALFVYQGSDSISLDLTTYTLLFRSVL